MMMTDEGEGDDGGDGHYGEDDDGSHNITMCNVEPMGLCAKKTIFLRALYFSMYTK